MIIGLCGPIDSGKSYLAKRLVAELGFTRLAFADALKDWCATNAALPDSVSSFKPERMKFFGWTGTDWTGPKGEGAREILCEVGERMRKLDEGYWLKQLQQKVLYYQANKTPAINIVIDDPRYINELNWIVNQGGKVHILGPRRDAATWSDSPPDFGSHPSECQWRAWAWNRRESQWTQESTFENIKSSC